MTPLRKQQIQQEIEQVKRTPINLQELLKDEENEARFVQGYLSNVLSHQEYKTSIKTNLVTPEHIILHSIEELQLAFECLNISDNLLDSMLNHEIEHFNEAIASGFPARFIVVVFKNNEYSLSVKVGTQVNLKYNNLSEEQRKIALRNVISAPLSLSNQDIKMLQ